MNFRLLCAALLGLTLMGATPVSAEEGADVEWAIPVFLRIISFDSTFSTRVTSAFVVLIPTPAAHSAEGKELLERAQALRVTSVLKRPLKFVHVDFNDAASLEKAVRIHEANAVLIAPSLSLDEVSTVARVANEKRLYSVAFTEPAIERGVLSCGIAKSDLRKVVISAKVASQIGAAFHESVFQFVKLVP